MAAQNVMQATDSNFDSDVMKAGQISLVDFWAEWCGPCRMLAPTIDSLANDFAGKVKVYKMNVDENPETPSKFGIRGIPTVILFKDGKMVDQIVGNQPKDAFVQAIQRQM